MGTGTTDGKEAGPVTGGEEKQGISAMKLNPSEVVDEAGIDSLRVTNALPESVKDKMEADMAVDPEEERRKREEVVAGEDGYDIAGTQERMDKMGTDYSELMDSQRSPEMLKFERDQAFRRSAGRTGFGSSGLAAERKRQNADQERVFLKRLGLDTASIDKKIELVGKKLGEGATVYAQVKQDQQDAAKLAVDIGKENIAAYDRQYARLLSSADATIKNNLKAQANKVDRLYKSGQLANASEKQLTDAYKEIQDIKAKIGENVTAVFAASDSGASPQVVQAAIETELGNTAIPALIKSIETRIDALTGGSLTGATGDLAELAKLRETNDPIIDALTSE